MALICAAVQYPALAFSKPITYNTPYDRTAGGNMELRHLRYFIAVAEELNFTRAAERIGIQQPPLSQQIKQLEHELGAPLFRRCARSVELTEAGKLMLEEARIILGYVEQVKADVARHVRGEIGKLHIGSSWAACLHPLVAAIIREYTLLYPEVVVTPEESNTPLVLARLQARAIDVGFVRGPIDEDGPLHGTPLVEEKAVMAVPVSHALGRAASAPLSALSRDRFILLPRAINQKGYDILIGACRAAGFEPRLGQEAPQFVSVLPLIAAGLGVSLLPESISRVSFEGVNFVTIEGDAPRADIWLAHRRDNRSASLRNLLAVAGRVREALAAQNG